MSSDLLEDCRDRCGTEVSLTMKANGCALLDATDDEGVPHAFILMPDEQGLAHAERIEQALAAWRDQVKRNRR
jgi:hypothetical protein